MKKTLLCAVLIFGAVSISSAGIDFESKAMQLAGEIIANPAAFFYDFQQDLEGTTPLPPGKSYGFQTGLFPTTIPMGYTNLSGKYRLHAEGRIAPGFPQLDLIGGYWNMIWAKVAAKQSDDIDNAKFNGHYMGFILSSSVSPRMRTFWGYKRSQLTADLKLNKTVDFMGTDVSSFNSGLKDDFFIVGIEHPKTVGKLWSMQLNYGIREKVISAKVSWYGKYFEMGLNIFPEGVLVIHPVWNFHLNF